MAFFRKRRFLMGYAFAACLFCNGAFAYIPPSKFLVKTWVNKHSGLKAVRMKNKIIAFEDNKPTQTSFTEVVVYHLEDSSFKSWALDEAGHKLYSVEKKPSSLSLVSKFFLSADSKDVMESLREKAIPVRTEEDLLQLKSEAERTQAESLSLARWAGSVSWVVGVPELKDAASPQLWFEKDTFIPLRIVFGGKDQGMYDFRFENFHFYRGIPFPRLVNLSKKGAGPVLSSQMVDITIGPEKSRSESISNGFTSLGESSPQALKDLIRSYYEAVR